MAADSTIFVIRRWRNTIFEDGVIEVKLVGSLRGHEREEACLFAFERSICGGVHLKREKLGEVRVEQFMVLGADAVLVARGQARPGEDTWERRGAYMWLATLNLIVLEEVLRPSCCSARKFIC